jgi:hypothetical protein
MSWWSTSSSSRASWSPGWGSRSALLVLLLLAGACADPAERDGTAAATTAPTSTTSAANGGVDAQQQLELFNFCVQRFPDHCAGVVAVSGTVDIEQSRSQIAAQGSDPSDPGATAQPGQMPDPERTVKTLLEGLDKLGKTLDEQGIDAQDVEARMQAVKEAVDELRAGGSPEAFKKKLEALGFDPAGLDMVLPGGEHLVVDRRPLPALDAAIQQRVDKLGIRVSFANARYSYKYLADLAKRILSGPLRARYRIEKTITQPDGSGVQVLTPDASRARKPLRQEYGPAVIVVEPGP